MRLAFLARNYFFTIILYGLTIEGNLFYSQELVKIERVDSISVFYKSGSSALNDGNVIKRLNQLENKYNGKIVLKGYTDTIGDIEYNRKLAIRRLQTVSELIGKSNFKTFEIETINLNEQRSNARRLDSLYRRVDILIYKFNWSFALDKPISLQLIFESSQDRLVGGDRNSTIDQIALILKSDTNLKIKLNGHVCCLPDQALSLARAERVKKYLVKAGVNEGRISCEGYSNTQPLPYLITKGNMDLDKRVELIFYK